MIQLRPHHLLCTQGYSGNGYSQDFVHNMNFIVSKLKDKSTNIELVFHNDSICESCPNLQDMKCNPTEDKVREMDSKVIKHFHLKEKIYNYQDLIKIINSRMTPEIMEEICGTCSWYPISNCRQAILIIK